MVVENEFDLLKSLIWFLIPIYLLKPNLVFNLRTPNLRWIKIKFNVASKWNIGIVVVNCILRYHVSSFLRMKYILLSTYSNNKEESIHLMEGIYLARICNYRNSVIGGDSNFILVQTILIGYGQNCIMGKSSYWELWWGKLYTCL